MHRFIDGEDRMQPALLPHCLEDYVDEENPVRVVDRVHASNRSDSRARPTTTRLGLETGAYLSVDEALKLPDLA